MYTPCARFPAAGIGPRCSVFGSRRRTESGTGYQGPGAGYRDAAGQSGNKAVGQ